MVQAQEYDEKWRGEFASVLTVLGADPEKNWRANFTTGELTLMDPNMDMVRLINPGVTPA
jgi:hypothetical protein